jgi:anaerobic selenocysteine-containing dehydrogenase/bacterioferritin-associated ferredoxin
LEAVRTAHGPDAIGVFGSGALTNEKAYALGKWARLVVGTGSIDYNGRYCMASAAAGQNQAFGIDRGLPFPLADVARTRTLVLWGANPAETMPPLWQWVDRLRAAGGSVIVVDPRHSESAARADLHVQPVPGTDLAVLIGLLHLAVVEHLTDRAYIDDRTTGWERVRRDAITWTPDRVERVSGVPAPTLRRLVHALADPGGAMLLSGRGPEQQHKGTDTVLAMTNLMLALGQVGRPAAGYGCITGQGNGQGGREHGQKADQLPGYRLASDPTEARYAGAGRATRLKVAGIDVAAMGVRDPGPDDEVVTVRERRRQVHRRLIVRDGRLAGATLCGDPEAAATLVGLYDRQAPLPERSLDLFCSTGAFVGGGHVATVCTCNQVDEARITTAIEAGAGSVEAVALPTRAGTGCGTCRERIGELVASLAPAPAPTGG